MKALILLVWLAQVFNTGTPLIHRDGGFGTGIVVRKDYVLTASHIFGENLMVNGQPAEVVGLHKAHDLMLLKTSIKGKASFAEPQVDEEIVVVSYGKGIKMVTHGRIAAIPKDKVNFLTDITTLQGASGAAVYNLDGKVVGMVVGGIQDDYKTGMTVCVHSRVIKEFLKGALP